MLVLDPCKVISVLVHKLSLVLKRFRCGRLRALVAVDNMISRLDFEVFLLNHEMPLQILVLVFLNLVYRGQRFLF